MISRRALRDNIIRVVTSEVIEFIEENEDELLKMVHEELEHQDSDLPEEEAFLEVHFADLGEEMTRATLKAVKRFYVSIERFDGFRSC